MNMSWIITRNYKLWSILSQPRLRNISTNSLSRRLGLQSLNLTQNPLTIRSLEMVLLTSIPPCNTHRSPTPRPHCPPAQGCRSEPRPWRRRVLPGQTPGAFPRGLARVRPGWGDEVLRQVRKDVSWVFIIRYFVDLRCINWVSHDGISRRDHQKTIKKNGIVRRFQTLRNLLDKRTRLIPQFPNSRRWLGGRISHSLVACSAKGTHGPPVRRSAWGALSPGCMRRSWRLRCTPRWPRDGGACGSSFRAGC